MTVERIPRESFINETRFFYEVEARWTPGHSTPEQVEPWPLIVYSELRYGLRDVGRAGDV